ncbi:hypothetical protein ACFQ9X_28855 [Catenulispora yoronensis]
MADSTSFKGTTALRPTAPEDAPSDSILINPPPKQMEQLDWLLGEYRGLTTPVPDEGRCRSSSRAARSWTGTSSR